MNDYDDFLNNWNSDLDAGIARTAVDRAELTLAAAVSNEKQRDAAYHTLLNHPDLGMQMLVSFIGTHPEDLRPTVANHLVEVIANGSEHEAALIAIAMARMGQVKLHQGVFEGEIRVSAAVALVLLKKYDPNMVGRIHGLLAKKYGKPVEELFAQKAAARKTAPNVPQNQKPIPISTRLASEETLMGGKLKKALGQSA